MSKDVFKEASVFFDRGETPEELQVVVSDKRAMHMASMTPAGLRMALNRGRLHRAHVYVDGVVQRGITLYSLAKYHGWPQALLDQILDSAGLAANQPVFWTFGPEPESENIVGEEANIAMRMDERQLTVCAIALFADGFSKPQIAGALGVDEERAQQLIENGADEQAAGTMGHMKQHREPWSRGD